MVWSTGWINLAYGFWVPISFHNTSRHVFKSTNCRFRPAITSAWIFSPSINFKCHFSHTIHDRVPKPERHFTLVNSTAGSNYDTWQFIQKFPVCSRLARILSSTVSGHPVTHLMYRLDLSPCVGGGSADTEGSSEVAVWVALFLRRHMGCLTGTPNLKNRFAVWIFFAENNSFFLYLLFF